MWAQNNPNGGATFSFTIPSSQQHLGFDDSEEITMKNKRILLVDDESDITTVLTFALEDYGFEVESYNNPLVALSNFKPNYYDLAILD